MKKIVLVSVFLVALLPTALLITFSRSCDISGAGMLPDMKGGDYSRQWELLQELFCAYIDDNIAVLENLADPAVREHHVPLFRRHLHRTLAPGEAITRYSFRFLPLYTSLYRDPPGGLPIIMADVAVCGNLSIANFKEQTKYERELYLFYHFHFDESGKRFAYYDYSPNIDVGENLCAP